MAIEWTPALAVGFDIVDRQHQELFRRVNSLVSAMQAGQGKEAIDQTLKFLEGYVVDHFGTEQRLMQLHRYPQALAHTAQHQAFLETFKKLKAAYKAQGASPALAIQLQQVVCGWLREHIGKSDKAMGGFLASADQPGRPEGALAGR